MKPYSEMALVDLLDAFASNEPVPGGGSAAALAGSLGASLLIMVAGLPKTRTDSPEEVADLSEASARLRLWVISMVPSARGIGSPCGSVVG